MVTTFYNLQEGFAFISSKTMQILRMLRSVLKMTQLLVPKSLICLINVDDVAVNQKK